MLPGAAAPAPGSVLRARTPRAFARSASSSPRWTPRPAERELAAHEPARVEVVQRGNRRIKRVKVGDCWYRTLDIDAGIRAYMGPRGARRFWHGYYSQKTVCHFTGGVVFPGVCSASRQEYDLFEDVYDNVCRIAGAPPQTAIGDKGYSVASAFRKCTINGTAPVFPWRPGNGNLTRHDHPTHDRHGVPRCKHRGAPTHFVRFSPGSPTTPAERRKPRLWVRCLYGTTPACANDQTISCATDWKLLVPLWRTDALYHELKESHSSYEAIHDWWRDRYKVAADDFGIRPKVRSMGFHRLRANVAALVEWLRICHREGWLGSARRNHREVVRAFQDTAASGRAGGHHRPPRRPCLQRGRRSSLLVETEASNCRDGDGGNRTHVRDRTAMASTSVARALISPSARLAGGVAGGQLPKSVPGLVGAILPG